MWARSAIRDGSITSPDHNAFIAASMLPEESNFAPSYSAGSSATTLPGSMPPGGWASRNGSRAPSAQQDLEAVHNLESEIVAMGLQVLATEREVEEVQEAFSMGGAYRGRAGEALAAVEMRLVRKEQQLREKEKLLREEKVVLLRSRAVGGAGGPPHRVASAEGDIMFLFVFLFKFLCLLYAVRSVCVFFFRSLPFSSVFVFCFLFLYCTSSCMFFVVFFPSSAPFRFFVVLLLFCFVSLDSLFVCFGSGWSRDQTKISADERVKKKKTHTASRLVVFCFCFPEPQRLCAIPIK